MLSAEHFRNLQAKAPDTVVAFPAFMLSVVAIFFYLRHHSNILFPLAYTRACRGNGQSNIEEGSDARYLRGW